MRRPLIAANWKMHKTTEETREFITRFVPLVEDVQDVEIVIAPPFTSLAVAAKFLKGSNVKLAGQNLFWEEKGAFTGEISAPMLRDVECEYVIVGHSERRQYFGETDETVNRRVRAAHASGLKVILCIGETLEQREAGSTFDVLKTQLLGGLKDIDAHEMLVIAYEPVWAIGTGKTATPEQAEEAHQFIRQQLSGIYGSDVADRIRILYGGSVKPENVASLMAQPDVDGGLVGGASLKPDSFAKIVRFKEA
ncbi:MAG: triose-phosphate isomerase [Nitrospirae bacterium]|nr:MAG: triose-phosphate isomerase [Nitrospirota bacterium]